MSPTVKINDNYKTHHFLGKPDRAVQDAVEVSVVLEVGHTLGFVPKLALPVIDAEVRKIILGRHRCCRESDVVDVARPDLEALLAHQRKASLQMDPDEKSVEIAVQGSG